MQTPEGLCSGVSGIRVTDMHTWPGVRHARIQWRFPLNWNSDRIGFPLLFVRILLPTPIGSTLHSMDTPTAEHVSTQQPSASKRRRTTTSSHEGRRVRKITRACDACKVRIHLALPPELVLFYSHASTLALVASTPSHDTPSDLWRCSIAEIGFAHRCLTSFSPVLHEHDILVVNVLIEHS